MRYSSLDVASREWKYWSGSEWMRTKSVFRGMIFLSLAPPGKSIGVILKNFDFRSIWNRICTVSIRNEMFEWIYLILSTEPIFCHRPDAHIPFFGVAVYTSGVCFATWKKTTWTICLCWICAKNRTDVCATVANFTYAIAWCKCKLLCGANKWQLCGESRHSNSLVVKIVVTPRFRGKKEYMRSKHTTLAPTK